MRVLCVANCEPSHAMCSRESARLPDAGSEANQPFSVVPNAYNNLPAGVDAENGNGKVRSADADSGAIVSLPFSAFPPAYHGLLARHDANNDEHLDIHEILAGLQALDKEQQKSRMLHIGLILVIVFVVLLMGGVGGMTYAIVQVSKDTSIDHNVLTAAGGGGAIQTASTDFVVRDGKLQSRISETCMGSQCEAATIAVGQAPLPKATLSSRMADDDLRELKALTISQGSSWIHFQVMAVARYAESSLTDSVVVLYTHLGELSVNDVEVRFHERLEGAFQRAGFDVGVVDSTGATEHGEAHGRRLLGLVDMMGYFNSISDTDTSGNTFMPSQMPAYFEAEFDVSINCASGSCDDKNTGELVDWAVNGEVSWKEIHYFLAFGSKTVGRFEMETPQYPGQVLVELNNDDKKRTGQVLKRNNKKYLCQETQADHTSELTNALGFNSAKLEYVGKVTVEGEEVFKWKDDTGIAIYERIGSNQIWRIETGPKLYELTSVKEQTKFSDFDGNGNNDWDQSGPSPASAFSMTNFGNSCCQTGQNCTEYSHSAAMDVDTMTNIVRWHDNLNAVRGLTPRMPGRAARKALARAMDLLEG